MALNKLTYVDNVTVIPASNLNAIQDAIIDLENDTGGGLTEDVKVALLDCFEHVAWSVDNGQDYVDALEDALYPPINLVSISAVYTPSGTVYDTYTLNTLKPDLVVTGHYDDGRTAPITGYALSGTLEAGTSVITVSYNHKTTTFNVTVTSRIPAEYRQVEYLESDFTQAIETDISPRNTRTVATFAYTSIRANADNFVTGVYNSDVTQRYYPVFIGATDGKLVFMNRTASGARWSGAITLNQKYTVDYNNSLHQAILDGDVKLTDSTFEITQGTYKIVIFARGRDDSSTYLTNSSASKIYSLLYEDNDTGNAIGEFIPCYRKSDNVGGFYDLVTEAFYTDVLNGNPFVWGAEHWEE